MSEYRVTIEDASAQRVYYVETVDDIAAADLAYESALRDGYDAHGPGSVVVEEIVTLTLTRVELDALAGLVSDYVEAHTDHGYDPPYNGDEDLLSIDWKVEANR